MIAVEDRVIGGHQPRRAIKLHDTLEEEQPARSYIGGRAKEEEEKKNEIERKRKLFVNVPVGPAFDSVQLVVQSIRTPFLKAASVGVSSSCHTTSIRSLLFPDVFLFQ